MLSIMERCKTGKARLRAMLPPGTRIAHKTGTLNGLGNDAGIVTLPDGRMFVISVFVMKDHMGHELRDRIMAEAARAAYDYFLFAPDRHRSEEHTSELQSLMRISYAVFCLKKKTPTTIQST